MKKFFYGMIALLSVSLFFLGCSSDSDDETTTTKTAAETFVETLGAGYTATGPNEVSLAVDKEIASPVTITVPEGVTLKVPAGKKLTVTKTGTLTITGTLAGEPVNGDTAAAAFVVKAGGTVTGSGNFYPAGGASVSAGTYVWDTDADGEGNAGWKQTVEDLTADYSLQEACYDDDNDEQTTPTGSGIAIVSALRTVGSITVNITLTGTFDADYVYTADGESYDANNKGAKFEINAWGGHTSPAAGVYGAANFFGFVPAGGFANVAIKTIDPALVYYTGSSNGDISSSALEAPVASGQPNIYLGGTVPYKWKISGELEADQVLGLLLYDDGELTDAQKVVTLEIIGDYATETGTTPDSIITVDYSGVVFPEPDLES
jgi:hypothetical protein